MLLNLLDLLNQMNSIECIEFIDNNLKYGNVLVHCMMGISRSSTIVIAYLMKKYCWCY